MAVFRQILHSWIFVSLLSTTLIISGASPSYSQTDAIPTKQHCNVLFADGESAQRILEGRGQALPARAEAIQRLSRFAEENKLPSRWYDFGPDDRKTRRLVVAVDIKNDQQMDAYRKTFNLETPLKDEEGSGALVIEQTWEDINNPEHYIYTYIRSSAEPKDPVYRWGRKDETWESSFESIVRGGTNPKGFVGVAHIIELNKSEKENVQIFLDNPPLRGPCKSDNCVAWLTGTELGKTAEGVGDEERKYLFNELGVSRTIAPFEISRRLTHAANERYTAMVVFVDSTNGGLEAFKNDFEKNLIPEPKIQYGSILKNYTAKNPAEEVIKRIEDGEKVFLPIAAGASPDAVEALIAHSATLNSGVDLHVLVNGIGAQTFRKGVETTDGKFRVHALFLGGNLRELYREKKVSVVPGNLSDFTRIMRDPKQTGFHYTTILVRVSPADENGFHSLGPNHDMIMTILRDRPDIKIIAEVNPNIPVTNGDNKIHSSRIKGMFKSRSELAGPTVVPANEIDTKIGMYIGELVDSGATLQIGIGNIFDGVPRGLRMNKKGDIHISTEMFGDHMKQMIEYQTAVDAEAGFAFGSPNLYKWLNKNKKVRFVSTEYVNNPARIASIPRFHAVNTALQVDLYGQVNATIGPEGRISSPGGQVEFMSGAARSENGKAIIAIRSTAKNGTISSIATKLYSGPITTPHEFVTHVVTEYGVAELRGKNERERAIALIRIAHPNFQEALIKEAIEQGIITEADAGTIKP